MVIGDAKLSQPFVDEFLFCINQIPTKVILQTMLKV